MTAKKLESYPEGTKVRDSHRDGSVTEGVFVGFDGGGEIFERPEGTRVYANRPYVMRQVFTEVGWYTLNDN